VVIVAYVGVDHAAYLPKPSGIEIVCSPTPGATSAKAVQELIDGGAKVRFSDRLHMKVYWAERVGCLVTSANLTRNALGIKGLKEMGIFVDAAMIDIDRLLKEANPYSVSSKKLDWLLAEGEKVKLAMAKAGRRVLYDPKEYLTWYKENLRVRTQWKLAWFDAPADLAKATREFVKEEFGRSRPYDWRNVSKQIKKGDWLLCFERTNGEVRRPAWMYVDGVVRVEKSEWRTYQRDFPFQAFQAEEPSKYDAPPFRLGKKFAEALTKSIRKVGVKAVEESNDSTPPDTLLKTLARSYAPRLTTSVQPHVAIE
jgi:hypothetical protein